MANSLVFSGSMKSLQQYSRVELQDVSVLRQLLHRRAGMLLTPDSSLLSFGLTVRRAGVRICEN